MPRVLFWNVQRKQLDPLVLSLIAHHALDIVVLIESPPRSRLAGLLAPNGWRRVTRSDRFTVFAKQTIQFVPQPYPDPNDRIEFWRVEPVGENDWLFAVVHGPDRRNNSDATRRVVFGRMRATIRLLESRLNHRRTVVFGDLNSNPFEPSVLDADGLHGIGVKRVLRRGTERGVKNAGRSDFFYNPMWRLYGYDPAGDAGAASYHFMGADATEPYWHMLDQVLIRPEYADRLPPNELRVLTAAGGIALTDTDGRPDPDRGSDHLPVAFALC